jgi:AsmA protein
LVTLCLLVVFGFVLKIASDRLALAEVLVGAVRAEMGRDLAVAGSLSFRFLPQPGLVIEAASLAGAKDSGDTPLIWVARGEILVKPWALLLGRLEPAKARLSGVHIALVRRADGRGNWEAVAELAAERRPPTPIDGSPGQDAPLSPPDRASGSPVPLLAESGAADASARLVARGLRLDGVEISDSTLTWEDQRSGQRLALQDLNLASGPMRPGAPLGFSLSSRIGPAGEEGDARLRASAVLEPGEGGAFAVTDIAVQVAGLPATEGFDDPVELTGNLSMQAGGATNFDLKLTALDLDGLRSLPAASQRPTDVTPIGPRVPTGYDDSGGASPPPDVAQPGGRRMSTASLTLAGT